MTSAVAGRLPVIADSEYNTTPRNGTVIGAAGPSWLARPVSGVAKRGTMTLGKPAIGREGVIACVSQTTQGRFLHRRLVG